MQGSNTSQSFIIIFEQSRKLTEKVSSKMSISNVINETKYGNVTTL